MFFMPDKELNVIGFHFQKGNVTNFEGYFTLDSSDSDLEEFKKEMRDAKSELPKYQLNLTTRDGTRFQVIDCWIEKFEFESNDYRYTNCYFMSNEVYQN